MVAALAPLLILVGLFVLVAVGAWPYGIGAALVLAVCVAAAGFGLARFFLRRDTVQPPRTAG